MTSPFGHEHADPWGRHFLDLESLNAHVTDRIADLLVAAHQAARRGDREGLRTTSLLVLGPAGTGKTHLFARLRRKLGPTAAFVHIRPDIGVATTPRHVLAHVVDALSRETASLPARQIDVVLGCLLAAVHGAPIARPLLQLDDYRRTTDEERADIVEQVLGHVELWCPDLHADYLELLLALPILARVEQRAVMTWLSGREPSEAQLARLGRKSGLDDTEVLPALRTLAAVSALGAPLVLVFDQLENLIDPTGDNDRIVAYGTLVSELRDNVRGFTLAQMALDTEWVRGIRPVLGASQRTRVEGEVLQVAMPTPAQRTELVRLWVEALPVDERGGRFPAPFAAEQVRTWCDAADMTPRALMIACRRAIEAAHEERMAMLPAQPISAPQLGPTGEPRRPTSPPAAGPPRGSSAPPKSIPPRTLEEDALALRLESLWAEHVAAARREVARLEQDGASVSSERLAGPLVAAAGLLVGLRALARPQGTAMAVTLEKNGRRATVLIVQQQHPRSVAVCVRRAAELAQNEPVLCVRDRGLPFKPSWEACEEQRRALLGSAHGAWHDLAREDLVRLLAAHDFLAAARSQDLTAPDGSSISVETVRLWLVEHGPTTDEGVLAAVLATVEGRRPSSSSPVIERRTPTRVTQPYAGAGAVVAILADLGLASVERLVREARKRVPGTTRSLVEDELVRAGDEVRWLSSSLVCIREPAR
jgi:hypothetical protein